MKGRSVLGSTLRVRLFDFDPFFIKAPTLLEGMRKFEGLKCDLRGGTIFPPYAFGVRSYVHCSHDIFLVLYT